MMLLLFLVLVLSMFMSHIVVDHTKSFIIPVKYSRFLVRYGSWGWHDMVGMVG